MSSLTVSRLSDNDAAHSFRSVHVKQLRAALNADDYSTAELVLRRQLKVRPKDAEIAYRLGLARQEQLELEDAANIMRRLVAVKQHEKAARWLIKHEYIGKNWAELDQEQRDEFGALLAMIHQSAHVCAQRREGQSALGLFSGSVQLSNTIEPASC